MFKEQLTAWYDCRDHQASSKGLLPEHEILALDDVDAWPMPGRRNNVGLQLVGLGALHQKCMWVPNPNRNYTSCLGVRLEEHTAASQFFYSH